MFGKELAKGDTNLKSKVFYWLFSLDHLGQRFYDYLLSVK